jgi:tetratricopeptide (TPR) repeat protein
MGWALGALAEARSRQGQLDDALAHALIALDCSERAQDRMYVAVLRRVSGDIHLRLGQPETAVEEMRARLQQIDDYRLKHEYVLGAYAGLAETSLAVLSSMDHPAARKAALKQIGKLCRQAVRKATKFKNWLGAAYRVSGLYESAAGRPQAAARCFERSIEASREIGARYELATTYLDLGRFLTASARPGAQEYFALAKALFEECGATRDRDKAEELSRQLGADAASGSRLHGPHELAAAAADRKVPGRGT